MARLPLVGLGMRLKRAGLKVKKCEGWETRGSSDFAPRATMFHHTASNPQSGDTPCLGLVMRGTSAVSGPLCNVLIGRSGVVVLVAAGRANHAGLGGPLRGIPKDSANKYSVGFEVEHTVGEPWTKKQLEACDKAFAVTLRFLGRRARRHMGHKEWAPTRKIDPSGIDMARDRRRVATALRVLRRRG